MEMRAAYIVVGSAVMIVVALAFAFVLWIGSGQREFDSYDVIFRERVTGLSNGSIVRFNGIQKGEVESLTIDPNDPSVVIARVRVDKDTPIKTDTTAELEPVGFTGLAIIQFVAGSAEAPLLKDVSENRVPRIEADTAGIAAFLQSTENVIKRASLLLSDENIQNIADTLANVETVTGAVAENRDDISDLIKNVNRAATELTVTLENLREASDGLEELMTDDAPRAVENADQLITETRALMNQATAMLEENREALNYFAEQGLGQVAPAVAEARALMQSLDHVLRELERDPKAFFLGEATPEYEADEN